jgi:hypothetical protein
MGEVLIQAPGPLRDALQLTRTPLHLGFAFETPLAARFVRRREPFSVPPNAASLAFAVDRCSETIFLEARTFSASFALVRPLICRFSPVSAMT